MVWGHSSVLDLDLCWDRGELRLRDPRTGQFLPTPDELQAAKEAAEERADAERVAREAAEIQVVELESKLRLFNVNYEASDPELDPVNPPVLSRILSINQAPVNTTGAFFCPPW